MAQKELCPVPGDHARMMFRKLMRGEITLKDMQDDFREKEEEFNNKKRAQQSLPLDNSCEKKVVEH